MLLSFRTELKPNNKQVTRFRQHCRRSKTRLQRRQTRLSLKLWKSGKPTKPWRSLPLSIFTNV